ncbi:MAG: hypothetical protein KDA24_12545 [Deltaproteobacteria bacterium]|nr:hypothetical protein [Deltaproteobacteria bacterium]
MSPRRIVPLFALLLVGCTTGLEFEPMMEAWLDAPRCDEPDLVRNSLAPLRARLVNADRAGVRGELVQFSTSPAEFVRVTTQDSVEAVNVPSGTEWDALVDRGEIWAELTGGLEREDLPVELITDGDGAVQAWVGVDLVGICDAGIAFDTATVELTTSNTAAMLRLNYGATP